MRRSAFFKNKKNVPHTPAKFRATLCCCAKHKPLASGKPGSGNDPLCGKLSFGAVQNVQRTGILVNPEGLRHFDTSVSAAFNNILEITL